MFLTQFQCPECQGRLIPASNGGVVCAACGTSVPVTDGILDFVQGRADTILDPTEYDAFHQLDDARSNAVLGQIRQLAGGRWPAGLGSVLEVGCGTGLLSRALISQGVTRDLVLTDISTAMLRTCHGHLKRLGLLDRIPLAFATHGAIEPCFRDVTFDTCAGGSVLHHIPDVRGFLGHVFRWLRPGGRAFFMEPNLRFHRALAQTLADILAVLYRRDATHSDSRQKLLNLISQWRRGILHQGDLDYLATLEDKHMFAADTFEAMGRELGYAHAEVIPSGIDPDGSGLVTGLCAQLGIEADVREEVLALLPAFQGRYLALLSPREQTASVLLWLEKGVGPISRAFQAPPPAAPIPGEDTPTRQLVGGLDPHWSLDLTATATADGVSIALSGWCLLNTDIRWISITLAGITQDAPVWLPRPDVHLAIAATGLYPAWTSLCCGVDAVLSFDGVKTDNDIVPLDIEIILASGGIVPVPLTADARLDTPLTIRQ